MPVDFSLFDATDSDGIDARILRFLVANSPTLTLETANSPRAAGDAIQQLISENFGALMQDRTTSYSPTFARRAMADLAFTDLNDNYYVVDVKTHRRDTSFNMPNLTSIRRIIRLYEDDSNFFVILMVRYDVEDTLLRIKSVDFVPIEFLSWSCLTIGALGWGQIQIADANRIMIDKTASRKRWMLELCDAALEFYPREIAKINDRVKFVSNVQQEWARRNP